MGGRVRARVQLEHPRAGRTTQSLFSGQGRVDCGPASLLTRFEGQKTVVLPKRRLQKTRSQRGGI